MSIFNIPSGLNGTDFRTDVNNNLAAIINEFTTDENNISAIASKQTTDENNISAIESNISTNAQANQAFAIAMGVAL